MKRHLHAQKGREKLQHSAKTISQINTLFGNLKTEGKGQFKIQRNA